MIDIKADGLKFSVKEDELVAKVFEQMDAKVEAAIIEAAKSKNRAGIFYPYLFRCSKTSAK